MRGKRMLWLAAAAASFGAAAPAAEAVETTDATATCRTAYVDDSELARVCFEFDVGGSATTVAPRLSTMLCIGQYCGSNDWIALGTTGYTPGQLYGPEIDKHTLSVRWHGGSLGTVWIDGSPTPVDVPPFCVGTPEFCDGVDGIV